MRAWAALAASLALVVILHPVQCTEVQALEEAGAGEEALMGAMAEAQSDLAKVCADRWFPAAGSRGGPHYCGRTATEGCHRVIHSMLTLVACR